MAGNIKPTEAGSQPRGVRGQAGQLSDECSCGHVHLLLLLLLKLLHASDALAVSADELLCGGIKTSLPLNKSEQSNAQGNRWRTPLSLRPASIVAMSDIERFMTGVELANQDVLQNIYIERPVKMFY